MGLQKLFAERLTGDSSHFNFLFDEVEERIFLQSTSLRFSHHERLRRLCQIFKVSEDGLTNREWNLLADKAWPLYEQFGDKIFDRKDENL